MNKAHGMVVIGLSMMLSWVGWAQADSEPKVTLHVGDPAPALAPAKWIKGEPVKEFKQGTVYPL